MMRNKFLILLFGLLLAVGWTSSAQAQRLPAESFAGHMVNAIKSQPVLAESSEFLGIHSYMNSAHVSQTLPVNATSLKATSEISEMKDLSTNKKITRTNAPMRADGDLEMKSLTKAEADALIYWWDNGDGQGPRPSKSSDIARDPVQMYSLLRYVYKTPAFPGPYYSAYTKTNEREREVYYGGIDGGWNIPGVSASSAPVAGTTTVANGTTTNSNIPVSGNYQDWGYRSQMIYLADLLDMSNGDQITSITFYPSSGLKFAGSTVVFQLCNTTETNFGTSSSSSTSRKTVSGAVTATISPSVNNSATEWTITFDSPLTYTGGNLLLDVYCQGYTHDGITGSYSSTPCYGANQTNYQSMYVTGSSSATPSASATGSNSLFLPKTTFNYTRGGGNVVKRLGDLTITDNGTSDNTTAGLVSSIQVIAGGNVIGSWDYATNQLTFPSPFNFVDGIAPNVANLNNTYYVVFNGATVAVPSIYLENFNSVKVVIKAYRYSTDYSPIIYVNGQGKSVTSTDYQNPTTLTWNIEGEEVVNTAIPHYEIDTYKPTQEGYTALLVAVKDDATQTDWDNYVSAYDNGYHSDSTMIVNYFTNNVDSIILLTEGVRIGSGENAGTVYNCSGTYNKFFFLGKGQARQKPDFLQRREILNQHLIGEYVPFRFMYEQFSPTSGEAGSQTKDFYSRMMDGHVYNVVHDCRSVIHLGHQFSMSGNNGTTPYALTGLNFFIPDYRLKYWTDQYTERLYTVDENNDTTWYEYGPYNIDGRIMNPYQSESADGNPAYNYSLTFGHGLPSNIAAWYAIYNQSYAPKVGIYKITLEANATSNGTYGEGNTFTVTLDWTSSLNEMAHGTVPQTYYLYYVTVDEFGNQTIADEPFAVVNDVTTYNYTVTQQEESQTFYYIVMGTPVDDEHSSFIAWSNDAHVTIPGYDDFMELIREHYESDFVIGNVDRGEKNYYRNFLLLTNVNDDNALTTTRITTGGENQFVLQRYVYDDPDKVKTDVATINLSLNNDGKHVDCTIDYNEANDDINEPEDNPTKYHRSTMHMQETTDDIGTLSVTGNGDIVITPSGYEVNFTSIKVTADGTTTTWNVADGDLPNGWHLSPSNWWTEYEGGYYLDGGGYIYIPTNDATAARVEITAYGDGTSLAKVDVNGVPKAFANGAANAETKSWTVNTVAASSKAGNRELVTESVTVNENGTVINEYLPLLGYYYDYRQQWTQMIYTADQLGDLAPGDVIKSITFYPTTSTLILSGGEIHVYMASTTESNYDAAFQPVSVDYDNTLVASFTPVASTDCSNGWTITFDTPFTYDGGNIVIDIDTNIGETYTEDGEGFYGVETSSYMGLWLRYQDSSWGGNRQYFQPKATFTYETEGGGDTPEPEEAGMVRMRLPMVDEFSALTADNEHPRRYIYVLTYAPGTPNEKSTTPADVPVLHTDAVMHGFYTLEEINGDTKRNLDMNVLNAEVELELANLSSPYYYTINRKTNARPNVETGNRAVLQHRDDNWYQEMRDSSPRYFNEYEPGSTYQCLDSEGIVCGDEIGYNEFISYVPVVWTKGFDRRYYDEDERHNPNTAHNSYGASVFKTGAGQVLIGQSSLKAEKQIGQTGHWTEGEDNVNLYILSVDQVKGMLPTVSTIEYEPYMFRVFVESPNEKLRGFKFFEGTQDSPAHFEPDPDFTINDRKGPWCVWTEYLTGDYTDLTEIDFTKLKDETNWENNIRFAGLSDIIVDENTPIADGDLKIYVRFYYVVKGFKPQPNSLRAGGGDGGPAGYGSEGSAKPDPFVGINELHDGIVPVDVTYVNPQGMKSSRPFDGVNIVVTRYSDGSTRTSKIIR